MSFPQIVEVVIGLVLIYYILGAVVSTVTQIITELLETRGVALEKYLRQLAGDRTIDLTNLPQIKALRPIRYANWWNVFGAGTEEKRVEKIPASTSGKRFLRPQRPRLQAEFHCRRINGVAKSAARFGRQAGNAPLGEPGRD